MTPGDPYRVLGLTPGASLDDVKRAYRRLAKASHPDSAGPAATTRFIALQQAYETLALIAPAGTGRAAPTRPSRRPAPGARPRSGTAGASGAASSPFGASSGGSSRDSSQRASRADAGEASSARRRATRRAKLGTTTYDDAEPGRPGDWQGASWYGVSSGTYWTINPKEYADPRKHGPEYLARARRHGPEGDREDAPSPDGPPSVVGSRGGSGRTEKSPGLLQRIIGRARHGG